MPGPGEALSPHFTAVARDAGDPDLRADNIGFRVACRVVRNR
ncbi:MAG TPA: hypothetical protein VG013_25975 [Gemmataceae bacterium]|nr:hypothetical protein [Gemmataceae bacterium]